MYGYTPPQEDYLDPYVDQNTTSTFLFTPKGLGKREKRENWIWRSQSTRNPKHPEPFSYEYVMEDGQLAHIAEVHPANDGKDKAERRRRTRSTVKKVTFSERHSSPAGLLPSSHTSVARDESIKRSKSLSAPSTQKAQLAPAIDLYKQKTLPLLPKPTTSTHSRASLERTVSDFDIEFAQWGAPERRSQRIELAQQIQQRRTSPANSNNVTPRHSPAPSIQISPRRSFEEPRPAPSPPKRTNAPVTVPYTPPSTPPSHTLAHPRDDLHHKPTLKRKPSKFIEHLDEAAPVWRVDVTSDTPTSPIKVALPAAASGLLATPQPTPRSSVDKHRRVDSFMELQYSSIDRQIEIKPSPVIFQAGLQAMAGVHPWAAHTPPHSRHGSMDSIRDASPEVPDEDHMMSGAIMPEQRKPAVLPRRSMTVRAPGGKNFAPIFVGQLCTAQIRPVLRSPVIASGTARLVTC